jgi:hypothetical protein
MFFTKFGLSRWINFMDYNCLKSTKCLWTLNVWLKIILPIVEGFKTSSKKKSTFNTCLLCKKNP